MASGLSSVVIEGLSVLSLSPLCRVRRFGLTLQLLQQLTTE